MKTIKMTAAQKLYREITLGDYTRDVKFIANCILVGGVKPATRLKGLLKRVQAGQWVNTGNWYGSIRIDGRHYDSFSVLES